MPSRRSRTRSAEVESTQTQAEFRAHFEKLGLESEADYRSWCSNRALSAEGRNMHHCAASYLKSCRNGNTTIWSLSARINKTRIPVLTITIDPRTRAITQARGKFNASLETPQGRRGQRTGADRDRSRLIKSSHPILERWARQERLQMRR